MKYLNQNSVLRDPQILLLIAFLYGSIVTIGLISIPMSSFVFLCGFLSLLTIPVFKPTNKFSKIIQKKVKSSPTVLLCIIFPIFLGLIVLTEEFFAHLFLLRILFLYNFFIAMFPLFVIIPFSIYSKISETETKPIFFHPTISIVIPAYNEEKVIARTIHNVLETHYPKKEIIVVNDGSEDNTLEIIQEFKSKIIIKNKLKGGKASAINEGLKFASGEIIIILDADTIISKNGLVNIVQPFKNNSKIGAVSGNIKILNPINHLTKIQVLEYVFGYQIVRGFLTLFGAITIVSGAFGAFRRTVIQDVLPFTNDTITEDFDATLTILKSGFLTVYQNSAIAYTEAPETIADLITQRTRWYRGFMQGYFKHKDIFKNPNLDHVPKFAFFLMINSSLFFPFILLVNWISLIPILIFGLWELAIQLVLLSIIVLFSFTFLAMKFENEKNKPIWYLPLLFCYNQFQNFIFIKAIIEEFFRLRSNWGVINKAGRSLAES